MLSKSKKYLIWQTAVLPLLDWSMLVTGAALAYFWRYHWFEKNFLGIKKIFGWDYFWWSSSLAAIVVVIYAFFGLYKINLKQTWFKTFFELSVGIWIVLLSIITFFFFNEYNSQTLPQGVLISRFVLATVGFSSLGMLILGRLLWFFLKKLLNHFGFFKLRILLIDQNTDFYEEIKRRSNIDKILYYKQLDQSKLKKINKLIVNQKIDEVYVFSNNQKDLEVKLAKLAERYKVSYYFQPQDFRLYQKLSVNPILLADEYLFELNHSNLKGWWIVFKRLFDLFFAITFILIFWWLYVLIAIAIKLDSAGPIFYGSERVGPNGQVFVVWKFRRFYQEYCTSESKPESREALLFEQKLIEQQGKLADRGALYKIKNDPRMTKVGKFLEKTSLDELPQFFNVLLGNMSIVGPRPHQPREVRKYQEFHYKVFNAKPGITGLAQVNGRSDLSFDKEVELDTWYIQNWSFLLDLSIIVKTIWVVFCKRHT